MPITDKTRKILWGRSGNRCALCQCQLVMEKSASDPPSVIGDECHIISQKTDGPRGNPEASIEFDNYDNLILLCKTHHKLVDDQPGKYTVDYLKTIKNKHEEQVCNILKTGENRENKENKAKNNGFTFLPRIYKGKELVNIIKSAYAYEFDYDELENEEELEKISYFFQQLQDWGDILDEIEIGQAIKTQFYFNDEIKELEKMGFLVFGERRSKKINIGKEIDTWPIATIYVIKETNKNIINIPVSSEEDNNK